MRICIVGCGAIGGLYAAHLAQLPEAEVWAYDVSAEHVEAINRDGLRLTGHVELTAQVQARTDAREIPRCELGIVATKATFTERGDRRHRAVVRRRRRFAACRTGSAARRSSRGTCRA